MKRKLFCLLLALILLLTPVLSSADIVLPVSLSVIEDEAFMGDMSISDVVLPDNVKRIGRRAFADSSITSIHLPASLDYIADDAFMNCSSVTVTADEDSYAYRWAVRLGLIVPVIETPSECFTYDEYSDGVLMITGYTGEDAEVVVPAEINGIPVGLIAVESFRNLTHVTSVVLPDSVTMIDHQVFWGCSALRSIRLPEGLEYIGDLAFCGCSSLESIEFGQALTHVGGAAFSGGGSGSI